MSSVITSRPAAAGAAASASTQAVDPTDLPAVLREIAREAGRRELNDENPFEAIDLVRAARIGALRLPIALGGAGYSVREMFAAVIDLAEADPVVAHIIRTHYWFVEERLRSSDSDARRHWIGEIAAGKLFGNATSELGAAAVGSLRYATTLTPEGDGFVVNGTKVYCTGTMFSDYVNVWAAQGENALASLIIPTTRAGITMLDDWDGMGARKTGSGTTRFEGVQVRADEILGHIRLDAEPQPTFEFAFLQLYLQAIMAGILRNVVGDAVKLLKTRDRSFSHAPAERPADDPLLQQIVGELSASAFAAESTVLAAADAIDQAYASLQNGVPDATLAQRASLRAAQAKVHVDALAARAANQLFDVGSASAATRRKNLDRHWRAIRTLSLHNPTLYKALSIGKFLVNDEPLPFNGYF
ncbi:alkylation response protein AidB-like acyl-CoA dehydrogenase [Panacagrimonas perspica]|uniref:Dibenzothiophene monooxygenase n=2 Tax=Panacagrimonas perspica TaxID=381431 RepID=A0A4V3F6A6_9GAMM|nr:acyl-CoA dehydrogenase family protein [Panacagrimonas perspica]TDU31936.1 alkylation response protein AidB-like acyl-CoA dehydrogenase [Panacagrimonas perspica]